MIRAKPNTTKKALCLLLAAGMLLGVCGCKNQINMNQRMLIQGLGIDKAESGFLVTLQVSEAKEGQEGRLRVLNAEGKSVMDAVNNATLQLGKDPLYSHNMIAVLGRDCAAESLYSVLDFFVRWPECRTTVAVFMADARAEELLQAKTEKGEPLPAKDIESIARAGMWNGKAMRTEVLALFNALHTGDGSAALPLLKKKGDAVEIAGTAIFSAGKLAAVLDSSMTRGCLLVQGKLQGGAAVADVPEAGRVTLNLVETGAKITVSIKEELPYFDVKLSCTAGIAAIDSKNEAELETKFYTLFEQALAEQLKKQAEEAILSCVTERQSDIFRFDRILMQQETEYWRAHENDWLSLMKSARFNVSAKAEIKRVGSELSPHL